MTIKFGFHKYALALLLFGACSQENSRDSFHDLIPGKILVVVAHPDDETAIAPVLAKYSELGSEIKLVIATDGRHGVTPHAGIPSGDSLVAIREVEAKCSCKELGIDEPIFLDLLDGLGGVNGMSSIFGQLADMHELLIRVLDEQQPDVVLTFGPDGDSGHPDHRLVSNVITQVLLERPWSENPDLYYFGWTERQADKYEGWNLYHVHKENFDTQIDFDIGHQAKYFRPFAVTNHNILKSK